MSGGARTFEAVTCLGCGCSCDDIGITVTDGRITNSERACRMGQQWFGDGSTPALARVAGQTADRHQATVEAGRRLASAGALGRAMVYLAADLSSDGQRAAVALADRLGARIDNLSSDTVSQGILAVQRRGRAGATMGELRHRADVVVFWGVDPTERYPRFAERCVPDAPGLDIPKGRGGRRVIAVDVASSRGPVDADDRVTIAAADELAALSLLRAAVGGRAPGAPNALAVAMRELAGELSKARYCAVIYDAEPGPVPADPRRTEALIALTQALNTPTRATLCALRAGGNRQGSEQVLTWQTGYPMAVDFQGGVPRYQPLRSCGALLEAGALDCLLVLGDFRSLPAAVSSRLGKVQLIVIGPNASGLAPSDAIAIDTGRAGIHEGGTAFRLDDVPLPLTAILPGPVTTAQVLAELTAATTVAQ